MNDPVSDERKGRPVLDEQTFSKLLEAAYVLQEHNREMKARNSSVHAKGNPPETPAQQPSGDLRGSTSGPAPTDRVTETDYGTTLAKIVEIQHDIQVRHLNLGSALQLVVDRLVEITKAHGAAIGIIEGKQIRYRATAGKGVPAAESSELPNKSLSAACLKSGKVFQCENASADKAMDFETCKKRGIGSLIAAPVFHHGRVAGGLELFFSTARTFTDQDVHTCQLLAGLVTEALARDEEISWKKSLADERAAMLEALEKLQPNLAALIEQPKEKAAPAIKTPAAETSSYKCRKCGHELVRDEQFCGQCGTPRATDYEPPSTQSKVASAWQIQESLQKETPGDIRKGTPQVSSFSRESVAKEVPLAHSIREHVPQFLSPDDDEIAEPVESTAPLIDSGDFATAADETFPFREEANNEESKPSEALATTQVAQQAQWSSAASARAFLQKLMPAKHRGTLSRLWNTHRGDIYLVVAVVLVGVVILWGLWPNHSAKAKGANASANAAHRKSPESDLSFFERMLVQLGLAEAPPAPEDRGNPGVQVWVDLQTALYYCPGADLYGKTPKGKFTTQRAAQLDQFEPAYRKACN